MRHSLKKIIDRTNKTEEKDYTGKCSFNPNPNHAEHFISTVLLTHQLSRGSTFSIECVESFPSHPVAMCAPLGIAVESHIIIYSLLIITRIEEFHFHNCPHLFLNINREVYVHT